MGENGRSALIERFLWFVVHDADWGTGILDEHSECMNWDGDNASVQKCDWGVCRMWMVSIAK